MLECTSLFALHSANIFRAEVPPPNPAWVGNDSILSSFDMGGSWLLAPWCRLPGSIDCLDKDGAVSFKALTERWLVIEPRSHSVSDLRFLKDLENVARAVHAIATRLTDSGINAQLASML